MYRPIFMHTRVHACMYAGLHSLCSLGYVHVGMCAVYMYITYTIVWAHVHVCMNLRTHTCMHATIYAYYVYI